MIQPPIARSTIINLNDKILLSRQISCHNDSRDLNYDRNDRYNFYNVPNKGWLKVESPRPENTRCRRKYHCMAGLLFYKFGFDCFNTYK